MNKATVIVFVILTFFAYAVDFNPFYSHSKLKLDFETQINKGTQIVGSVENEAKSFLKAGLKLNDDSSIQFPIPTKADIPEFTFWLFFNTNNVKNNEKVAELSDTVNSTCFGFNPENGYPYLKHSQNGVEKAIFRSSIHIDGEAWRLFGIRKEGDKCDLLLNGVSIGSITLPAIQPAGELRLILASSSSKEIANTVNRYDTIHFYDKAFSDEIMKTHYKDEWRSHIFQKGVKTTPRQLPAKYIYEFDAEKTGNIIRNGSFELGTKGWHIEGNEVRELNGFRLADDNAPDGKYILSVKMQDNNKERLLQHYPIYVRQGGEYCFSLLARAKNREAKITLQIRDLNTFHKPRNFWSRNFTLNEDFRRCSVSAFMPKYLEGFIPEILIVGDVELDDVSLNSGSIAAKSESNSIMIDSTAPCNVFFEDEPLKLQIFQTNPQVSGTVEIFDEKDQLVFSMGVPPGIDELVLPFYRKGAFRVLVKCNGEVTDEHLFARLFRPLNAEVDHKSRYGAHYHNNPFSLTFASLIGSHWNRNHDSGPDVANWKMATRPAQNAFQFRFDLIELNRKLGQEIIARVKAPWKPEETTPAEFAEDIDALVRGYKGELKYIEIFNEPTAWFPPKLYADFLTSAYHAAHKADPKVKVLGLSTWDVVADFTRIVTETAGCEAMDIFSAHFYNWGEGAWLIPDGHWGQGFRVKALREYLDQQPNGKEVDIWHTESGIYMDSFFLHFPTRLTDTTYVRAGSYPHHPPRLGAIWMSQFFPVNFANGAKVVTYYAWGPTRGGVIRMNGHNMGEIDGSLKPGAAAFSASAHFLDYSEFVEGIGDCAANGLRAYHFRRNGKNTVVAWTQTPEPIYLKKTPTEYYDLMGNKSDPAKIQEKAFLNFNGTQREFTIPEDKRGLFYLDLETKYFIDMTLADFRLLLPEKTSAKK